MLNKLPRARLEKFASLQLIRTFIVGLFFFFSAIYLPAARAQNTDQNTDQNTGQNSDTATAPSPEQQEIDAKKEAHIQLTQSLSSLTDTLSNQQDQLRDLLAQLEKDGDELDTEKVRADIEILKTEIAQKENELEMIMLGLQSREYAQERLETDEFNIEKELGKIFEPLIISLERATEPTRRMEELRQLSEQVGRRREIVQKTLDHIGRFDPSTHDYPHELEKRLLAYQLLWQNRLRETNDLSAVLDEQKAAALDAQGNTLKKFLDDIGNFVLNRGASLVMAIGSAIIFILFCQFLMVIISRFFRERGSGYLNAPIRILNFFLMIIAIMGALMIAIAIFNLRHDWLMLMMSLLLAFALAWSFVRALPTLLEEMRAMLNLGSIREGERTMVNGVPYRIERLGMYSRLINPQLSGGSLVFPIRELINMHSRPVVEGEAWFPTQIGDWIIREGKHYKVINQTPEHVVIERPGGAQDHIPVREFFDTVFETLSGGYRRSYNVGLSYKHLAGAIHDIPHAICEHVQALLVKRLDPSAIIKVEALLVDLNTSSLDFCVHVNVGPGQGEHWQKIQSDIANGVVNACQAQGWEIPYPQLVLHRADALP